MKFIIGFLFTFILFPQSIYAATAVNTAVETGGIKVEYFDSTKKGIIQVFKCSQCTKKYYEFLKEPKIIKSGKSISLKEFMQDYWNAKFPTLILERESKLVLKVVY